MGVRNDRGGLAVRTVSAKPMVEGASDTPGRCSFWLQGRARTLGYDERRSETTSQQRVEYI